MELACEIAYELNFNLEINYENNLQNIKDLKYEIIFFKFPKKQGHKSMVRLAR